MISAEPHIGTTAAVAWALRPLTYAPSGAAAAVRTGALRSRAGDGVTRADFPGD